MSFGSSKKVRPPALPDPVPSIVMLEARRPGQAERKRSRGQKMRFTTPGFMAPATVGRRELKTKFG